MPDGFGIQIDSKSLEEKLKSLSQDMQDRIVNTALREGALVYRDAVSEAAPERTDGGPNEGSNSLPAGALKSDVIVQKVPKSSEYVVRFGKLTAHVARFVDEGHRLVRGGYSKLNKITGKKRGPGKEVGSVAAYPFFRGAFEIASADAEKAISSSITDQVNKKWKG